MTNSTIIENLPNYTYKEIKDLACIAKFCSIVGNKGLGFTINQSAIDEILLEAQKRDITPEPVNREQVYRMLSEIMKGESVDG